MRREVDLRAEPIGTYEFPLPEEKAIDVNVPVCLRNLTFSNIEPSETSLMAKLFYTSVATSWTKPAEDQEQRCAATFELRGHGYEDLDSFKRLAFSSPAMDERALLKNVYLKEATELLPLISSLGVDALNHYGEIALNNPKDINRSREAHILKALLIYCLAGRLYFQPQMLIAKLRVPTMGGIRSEYSFHIRCDGPSELTIALKLAKNGYLELISAYGDEYRFIV